MTPISWKAQHVKGHQARDPLKKLDQWAKLNIKAENLVEGISKSYKIVQGGTDNKDLWERLDCVAKQAQSSFKTQRAVL